MGLAVGLLLGIGLFLCLMSGRAPTSARTGVGATMSALLADAGLPGWRPVQLVLVTVAAGLGSAVVVLTISFTWSIAVVFATFGLAAPWLVLRRRVEQRRRERRELWPYVVDDLASGIRAGLALPEAVAAVAERGPTPLRPAFAAFAEQYRTTGSFAPSLDRLADELADPIADRFIAALRLARDVGGTDLGRLLRSLGQALRDDARARGEIEARQSWTVNGARLAVAAPWIVLLLLATRTNSIRVYDRPGGLVVLAVGAVLSAVAYLLMRRIGRLPQECRTLDMPR
jgi:tight adherence protein B